MSRSSLRWFTALLALSGASPAFADNDKPIEHANRPVTLAVIGDTPYGSAQISDFPNLVSAINADPDVERVVHVGDIKNGSSRCDTSYYSLIADDFAGFSDPLVYTPGDNEWTDCHRSNNGKYDPLERLGVLRDIFFAEPGMTLGATARVFTQADVAEFAGIPENVSWVRSRVVFSTLHVVGSRNGLSPWFGDDTSDTLVDDPERRNAEVEQRTRAALDWLERSFSVASDRRVQAQGVVLFMQADTWPGSVNDGFAPILQRLAELAASFGKPVLVVQGDSHVYRVDQPLASGDAVHGVSIAVPNLTRLVVQGETTSEWLKLRVDPQAAELFSWQRMQR
jgi:hypothetical protein